ncbi:hypothetical protein [Xanthobacter autotrophicus]|uniref:hypothetical protein n=1 Tax=Xanthobacter autotrophicus TaxID=280 RepID=UPI00372B7C2B
MSKLVFRRLAPDFFDRTPLTDVVDPVAVAERDHLTADLLDALTRGPHDLGVPRRDFWIGVIQKVRAHRIQNDKAGCDGLVATGHALCERHHHDLKGGQPAVSADGDFVLSVKFLAHGFFAPSFVFAPNEAQPPQVGDGGGQGDFA